MINAFDNMQNIQKFGQTNMDGAMTMWGAWSKNWQTIATEMGEYSKRSFEDGAATFQKLLGAKSVEQALAIRRPMPSARPSSISKKSIKSAACTRPSPRMP